MLDLMRRNVFMRELLIKEEITRAAYLFNLMNRYFSAEDRRILDIGSGTCLIAEFIWQIFGVSPIAIDVNDFSLTRNIQPLLYNGSQIPFGDHEFDLALIISVLHHTPKPVSVEILKEAKRVARKILIIEDIFTTQLEKYRTFFLDSVTNLEFIRHPHSNRTDAEWQALFADLDLKIEDQKKTNYNSFQLGLYYLSA
jgi:SAM-dependent methyltransferase